MSVLSTAMPIASRNGLVETLISSHDHPAPPGGENRFDRADFFCPSESWPNLAPVETPGAGGGPRSYLAGYELVTDEPGFTIGTWKPSA